MGNRFSRTFLGLYEKLPRFLKAIVSRVFYAPKLGKGVHLLGWVIFSQGVKIGDYTYINANQFIRNVEIGKFCCIAANLCVGVYQHPYWQFSGYDFFDYVSPLRKFRPIEEYLKCWGGVKRTVIGNDVWIGQNVVIKDGVTIGDGAVIGTSSVVTKDVPPFAIVAGVPAKIIKYRFDERKIKLMQDIKWWDWDIQKIYNNLERLYAFDEELRTI